MARPFASLRSRVFAATAVVAVLPVAAALLFVTRRVAQQAEAELGRRLAEAAPSPTRAVLDQRNETFVPPVLAVTVGSTVDFPNSDKVYHNVFSLSKTRRFDLGRYPRGQSRSVVFDRPGVVRVFCEIHSHMSAFILVFAHRFFAVTDAEGRYRIDGVPAGSYTLALWSEGGVRERRELRLEAGQALEQDLAVE